MPRILIGTRKGAWTLDIDEQRGSWKLNGPLHLGSVVSHYVADPRQPGRQLMSVGSGHLGPSVFISADAGVSWTEATSPPAFAAVGAGEPRSVDHVFWLTPGHVSEPLVWYAGTSPQGLFRSNDGGDTWQEVKGFNHHPDCFLWRGGDKDGTPDGPKLHSIIVDHTDRDHLIIGMSGGGIFESHDAGQTWQPLNKGVAMDFYPPKEDGSEYEYGHDPHCIVMHPVDNNRLYHQNHCGLYRLDRHLGDHWQRIGDNMPREVGDIGFPVVVHPRDPDIAWVFPMDGSGLWPRTSPDGRPAVFRTRDGGETFERLDKGFPSEQAWWTVKRQCMAADSGNPVALYLGTTHGQLWASFDEGDTWQVLALDLPQIYSVEVDQFGSAWMIQVFLPTQLESYTDGQREVTIDPLALADQPLTLAGVIGELDGRYRGLAFRIIDEHGRIRRHIAIFVGETMVRTLDIPLTGSERIQIVGALSGG